MRQTRVVVVGSANMDLVAMAPALPRPGQTILGTDFVMVPGGKGANQAVAAVRAGASCAFLGAIGSDAFGVTLKARITAAGVDTGQLRVVYGASGVALVMVNTEGENAILVTPGANGSLTGLTEEERPRSVARTSWSPSWRSRWRRWPPQRWPPGPPAPGSS